MTDLKSRIAMKVSGRTTTILSIIERPSGDLVLAMKPARFFRDNVPVNSPSSHPLHEAQVINQKYSIHLSKNSPHNISTIKQQLITNKGKSEKFHYSSALRDGKFAHVYTRRFPNLKDPQYRDKKLGVRTSCIDTFDQECFILFASFFVCNPETELPREELPDLSYYSEVFGAIKLCVLWSYLGLMPTPFGDLVHTTTLGPLEFRLSKKEFARRVEGIEALSCFDLHRQLRGQMKHSFNHVFIDKGISAVVLERIPFMAKADVLSPLYLQTLREFGILTILQP